MEYKKITVVDEQDQLIGFFSYDEAKAKNMLRRASVVMIFNEAGLVLVQRRSEHISDPLLLDKSCAGHVDEGETYHEAAVRELKEELGLESQDLTVVVSSFRSEQFFDTIYKLVIPTDTQLLPDPHEVESIYWYTPEELTKAIKSNPELFTTRFVSLWTELHATLIAA
jgi:isopentenyldiphosphate isomerase